MPRTCTSALVTGGPVTRSSLGKVYFSYHSIQRWPSISRRSFHSQILHFQFFSWQKICINLQHHNTHKIKFQSGNNSFLSIESLAYLSIHTTLANHTNSFKDALYLPKQLSICMQLVYLQCNNKWSSNSRIFDVVEYRNDIYLCRFFLLSCWEKSFLFFKVQDPQAKLRQGNV